MMPESSHLGGAYQEIEKEIIHIKSKMTIKLLTTKWSSQLKVSRFFLLLEVTKTWIKFSENKKNVEVFLIFQLSLMEKNLTLL